MSTGSGPINYKDAGVDIEKGEALVEKIKHRVRATYGKRVVSGVGGFAGLYEITPEKLLAVGTDGVGTKLRLAQKLNIHNTIGQDLVAMCANDILCTGAAPLFFLDYLAVGKLDLEVAEALIEGIANACQVCEMALLGGETAEMPGLYAQGDYDLAGFAVGEVMRDQMLGPERVSAGQTLIGLASSGLHSNGYSLARKFIADHETEHLKQALIPTLLYWPVIKSLLNKKLIKGLAHITGGGVTNIPRMNEALDYELSNWPSEAERPAIINLIAKRSELPAKELFHTFNMGIGMVIATDNPSAVCKELDQLKQTYWTLGKTKPGQGQVHYKVGATEFSI